MINPAFVNWVLQKLKVDVASCRIEVIRLSSYIAVIDLGIDF